MGSPVPRAGGRWSAATALVLALAAVTVARAASDGGPGGPAPRALPGAVLEDCDGARWRLADLAGQPVVAIVAGRNGSGQATAWGEGIGRSRPGRLARWATPDDRSRIAVLSDADLRGVPALLHRLVRWRVAALVAARRREGRDEPPLLLDWEGVVATALGIDTGGDAVVVLLDAGRVERARFAGAPTDETLAAMAAAIDRLAPSPRVAAAPGVPGGGGSR